MLDKIIILDFGSQYTQLIAKRIRALKYYTEILPYHTPLKTLSPPQIKGIILSGGPESVYADDSPQIDPGIFELGKPILGICYGLQLMVKILGGEVDQADKREFGDSKLKIESDSNLVKNLPKQFSVWMSHSDQLKQLPEGFINLASTETCPFSMIVNPSRKLMGVQFHPEVTHTRFGNEILSIFLENLTDLQPNWQIKNFINSTVKHIRKTVGNSRVIMAISGGVDSSVAAVLLHQAIGDRLVTVLVDNGLMRKHEIEECRVNLQDKLGLNLKVVNACELFLDRLSGVIDPEKKRKIIGHTFIDVFEKEAEQMEGIEFLGQGTLYPDVIESISVKGPSATIKSHHNVGGLPQKMKLKIIEPLRELFKDEVREVGNSLNIPKLILNRHPFPGPGLAIRILGEVTKSRLKILREADHLFISELKSRNIYDKIWQAFCVLLPVKTVGVMGDARTYENVIAIRAVNSSDGMTANWYQFEHHDLREISSLIINWVPGVNRVVYDISNKPPSTIEWE